MTSMSGRIAMRMHRTHPAMIMTNSMIVFTGMTIPVCAVHISITVSMIYSATLMSVAVRMVSTTIVSMIPVCVSVSARMVSPVCAVHIPVTVRMHF